MRIVHFISLSFFIFISSVAIAGNGNGGESGNTKDTLINIKSNIVIFKMFNSSKSATANAPSSGGTLKKAGKVARTSNSHITTNRKLSFNEG